MRDRHRSTWAVTGPLGWGLGLFAAACCPSWLDRRRQPRATKCTGSGRGPVFDADTAGIDDEINRASGSSRRRRWCGFGKSIRLLARPGDACQSFCGFDPPGAIGRRRAVRYDVAAARVPDACRAREPGHRPGGRYRPGHRAAAAPGARDRPRQAFGRVPGTAITNRSSGRFVLNALRDNVPPNCTCTSTGVAAPGASSRHALHEQRHADRRHAAR